LAVGVDRSLYRLSRWVAEHKDHRPFIVADAKALPFRSQQFVHTVSSGMLEHVGVSELSSPYRVTALPSKRSTRAEVVAELCRVTQPAGSVILDFPNGLFPIDFWHGNTLGAFRFHQIPDVLNPSLWELLAYTRGRKVTVLPLRNRLRFRQIDLPQVVGPPTGRTRAPVPEGFGRLAAKAGAATARHLLSVSRGSCPTGHLKPIAAP
jgi:SAM-dependent methyltransferase